MVTFPNCKINLGLHILQKRADGFHDIETVFYPIPLYDVLEIIVSPNKATQLKNTGITTGDIQDNLCLKAYQLLKKDFPQLPKINMHLHKVIPIGAGLGGGSADAAFTLLLLNKKFGLTLSHEQLLKYSLQLGSDCPFFILNQSCLAMSRGEIMELLPLSLSGYKMLIVNPGIQISTKDVFQKIIPALPAKKIKEIILQPLSTWKNELVNDFEKIVFQNYPVVKEIKEMMYQHNAVYAAMSGTGSSVFGIFKANSTIRFSIENYFQKWVILP